MPAYIYADESGNFDFSPRNGASRFFLLTTVVINAHAIEPDLLELRRQLARDGLSQCYELRNHRGQDRLGERSVQQREHILLPTNARKKGGEPAIQVARLGRGPGPLVAGSFNSLILAQPQPLSTLTAHHLQSTAPYALAVSLAQRRRGAKRFWAGFTAMRRPLAP